MVKLPHSHQGQLWHGGGMSKGRQGQTFAIKQRHDISRHSRSGLITHSTSREHLTIADPRDLPSLCIKLDNKCQAAPLPDSPLNRDSLPGHGHNGIPSLQRKYAALYLAAAVINSQQACIGKAGRGASAYCLPPARGEPWSNNTFPLPPTHNTFTLILIALFEFRNYADNLTFPINSGFLHSFYWLNILIAVRNGFALCDCITVTLETRHGESIMFFVNVKDFKDDMR